MANIEKDSKSYEKNDKRKLAKLAKLENHLRNKYNFFLNEVNGRIEYVERLLASVGPLRQVEILWLLHKVRKAGIWTTKELLFEVLGGEISKRYNPLKKYFEGLGSYGKDGIKDYLDFVRLENEDDRARLEKIFRKWAVAAVKCVYEPKFFNKRCIIFVGPPDTYKTSFLRNILPDRLDDYIKENPVLVNDSKDSRFALTRNLIIMLDEFDKYLGKQDWSSLKAYITTKRVNDRRPYDRHEVQLPRISSFLGTSNKECPLRDETGTVRFVLFKINEKINPSYSDFNTDFFWATAYKLYKEGFDCELNSDEVVKNEESNRSFVHRTTELELLTDFFEKADESNGKFMTTTEVLAKLMEFYPNHTLNRILLGKALTQEGFKRVKKKKRYGYYVKKLASHTTVEPSKGWVLPKNQPPLK